MSGDATFGRIAPIRLSVAETARLARLAAARWHHSTRLSAAAI